MRLRVNDDGVREAEVLLHEDGAVRAVHVRLLDARVGAIPVRPEHHPETRRSDGVTE